MAFLPPDDDGGAGDELFGLPPPDLGPDTLLNPPGPMAARRQPGPKGRPKSTPKKPARKRTARSMRSKGQASEPDIIVIDPQEGQSLKRGAKVMTEAGKDYAHHALSTPGQWLGVRWLQK